MGRINWRDLLGFGRGLIAVATTTVPAFQAAEKHQRDTIINNTVINNATIINGTINNSTINNSTINNTSIHQAEITQHFHQEDPKTPNVNSPIKGSSHPSNNRL